MFVRNLKMLTLGGGSKMIRAQFAALGIDSEKAKKALSGPDGLNEVLLEVADRVQGMGRTGTTAALTRLFGHDAGRAILADFARGRKGIEELMQRRRGMGLISEQDAKNTRDLDNRIKDIKTSFSALGAIVVAQLAPSLIEMAKSAAKWMSDNKDLISGALVVAVKVLAMSFRELGHVIAFVGYIVRQVQEGNPLVIAALTALGALIFAWVLPALQEAAIAFVFVSAMALQFAIDTVASVLTSLGEMAAAFQAVALAAIEAGIDMIVAFAPFIALGVAIAAIITAIIYGIVLIVQNWQQVKDAFVKTWHEAVQAGEDFLDWIESLPGVVWDAVKAAGRFIIDEIGKAFDWVVAKAKSTWHWLEGLPGIG